MTNEEYRGLIQILENHFAAVHQKFDALDRRFDALDGRFDSIDGSPEDGFQEALGSLTKIEQALDRLGNVAPIHASIARIEQLLRV